MSQSTKKTVRGGKQCQYISSIGRRNEFDKRNAQQLGKHVSQCSLFYLYDRCNCNVGFGSPNFGATRLSASDADTVLLACRDFISLGDASISENENGDVDVDIVDAIEVGAMDAQEVSHHVDGESSEVLAEVVEERCSLDIEREECVVEGRSEDIHGESHADGRECEQSVECCKVERAGAGALPSSSRDADDSEQHQTYCHSLFEEAKLFLDLVPPMVNGGILEALIEVLPMSMPMKNLPAADVEIDAW
eukprot:gene1670-1859_t